MVQLSAIRCSCIATLLVRLASFATITLCVASQQAFIAVSICFIIDSVRKILDTPSYIQGVEVKLHVLRTSARDVVKLSVSFNLRMFYLQ